MFVCNELQLAFCRKTSRFQHFLPMENMLPNTSIETHKHPTIPAHQPSLLDLSGSLRVLCCFRKGNDMSEHETVSRYHCFKCGHEWLPRNSRVPKLCPKCHCRKWQGPTSQLLSLTPEEARALRNENISKAIRSRRAPIPPDIPRHICLRCGHEWPIRSAVNPRVCPKCNSNLWNAPRKREQKALASAPRRLKCLRCGHEWQTRYEVLPKTCPSCSSLLWNKPRSEDKRRRGKIRQQDVAKALGVSWRTVQAWEGGQPNPWGYSREVRRSEEAFAAFMAALAKATPASPPARRGRGRPPKPLRLSSPARRSLLDQP